jgi:DNA adenine methylase
MTRAATEPTHPRPPDLEALRLQLGDAIFEARLAVARRREQIIARVRAATAQGVPFADAAAAQAPDVSAATVRRWDGRWSRHGVAGLLELRLGPPPGAVKARPAAGEADDQLPLAGVLASQRPLPRLRSRDRRGGPPSALLKWPGSKAPIVGTLLPLSPPRFARYHEPFVGSGALFFALRPAAAFLSDQNRELVNLYLVVRDEPEALLAALARHRNTREDYYRVRGIHPDDLPPVERAARTLFLNRTCFNGIYRLNSHGLFNVPYGSQAHTSFFHPEAIRRAHRALPGTEIRCRDFEAAAGEARRGDFVYLDPPYAASGRTFNYQAEAFGEAEQRRVGEVFRRLDARGCLVMASNADCELTRQLYAGFEVEALSVIRQVGGHAGRRGRAREIVVRNYGGRRNALPGV